jgi:heme-degrading monooxygenase HmoA
MSWQLAQLNIARMRFEADAAEMKDFNDALDRVNASADSSPGFIWRLVSGDGDPDDEIVFDDPSWLVNLSVWENLDSLLAFVRSELHLSIMRRRREWFDAVDAATLVLWWVPEGHRPDVAEAQRRLRRLRDHGPSAEAFGFGQPFPPPEG